MMDVQTRHGMEEYVLAMGQPVPSAVVKDARTMPFREEFASDMVQRYIVKSRVMKDVPHFNRDAVVPQA